MEELIAELRGRGEEVSLELKEEIVKAHLPQVRFIAERLARSMSTSACLDVDDLYNTGVLGLFDAIDRYDPLKNSSFKSYAEIRIRGAMLDEIRKMSWFSRSTYEMKHRIEHAYRDVEQRTGRGACEEEVADALGMKLKQLQRAVARVHRATLMSYEAIESTSAGSMQESHYKSQFEEAQEKERTLAVAQALETLNKGDRNALFLYYYHGLTLEQIGVTMGVSDFRIWQRVHRAYEHMRNVDHLNAYL